MTNTQPTPTHREFILLVEDTPEDEMMFLRTFHQCRTSLDVRIVRDGAEALDFLFGTGAYSGRDTICTPLLILLDMHLPKLNGLEVLKRIKSDERTKSIPVTMMTGSGVQVLVGESLRCGADACLTKPITRETIEKITRQATSS